MLRELDDIPLNERLGYYKDLTRRCGHGDQMLFPPLARQQYSNNSHSNMNNPNNRHSIGGTDSRSVHLKYQDDDRGNRGSSGSDSNGGSASKSKGSALERVTGRDAQRVGFNRHGDNVYQANERAGNSQQGSGRKRERDNDRDWEDRGVDDRRQSGYHKQRRDASPSPPPSNSRRHSYPLPKNNNGASQHYGADRNKSNSHYTKNEDNYRGEQGSNSRPSGSGASGADQSNAAWMERIESRKRRFN